MVPNGFPEHLVPVRRLGGGPLSEVWEALDGDDRVAVKLLTTGTAAAPNPGGAARLHRELRLLSALESPYLRGLRDVVLGPQGAAGAPILVLEWIDGPDLGRLAATGPFTPASAALVGLRLAEALGWLHERGWIHRDVKPANVLVSREGRVVLSDLGLAWPAGVPDPPGDDAGAGTPAYMSPERLAGVPAAPSDDLWSLGVVLYRLLSGVHPFRDDAGDDLFDRIRAGDPPPPAGAPEALAGPVLACLRPRPGDRPASAAVLQEALSGFLDEGGEAAATASLVGLVGD